MALSPRNVTFASSLASRLLARSWHHGWRTLPDLAKPLAGRRGRWEAFGSHIDQVRSGLSMAWTVLLFTEPSECEGSLLRIA